MAITEIHSISVTPEKVLAYIARPEKSDQGRLIFSSSCSTDWELANLQMKTHRQRFGKDEDILQHHGYVSFEGQEISLERAYEYAMEWMEGNFSGYQYFGSVHKDTENVHFHFVINSVALDGHKYNGCTESLNELRAWTDELCERYGLGITIPKEKGKSYKEWLTEKDEMSWKGIIRKDIDETILRSDDLDHFVRLMEEQGYLIKHGEQIKHMVFKKEGMERGARGSTIGAAYTEEMIRERIQLKEFRLSSGAIHVRRKKQTLTAAQRNYWGLTHRKARLSTVLALWLHIMAGTKEVHFRKVSPSSKRAYQSKYLSKVKELSEQLFFVKENNITSRDEVNACLLNLAQQLNRTKGWKERKAIEREMQPYKKLLKTLEQIRERTMIPDHSLGDKTLKKSAVKNLGRDCRDR